MLLDYTYPYQPCDLHGSHGYMFHEQVLRTTSRHYHESQKYYTQVLVHYCTIINHPLAMIP
jgi:hypothetical protein